MSRLVPPHWQECSLFQDGQTGSRLMTVLRREKIQGWCLMVSLVPILEWATTQAGKGVPQLESVSEGGYYSLPGKVEAAVHPNVLFFQISLPHYMDQDG